MCKLKPNRNDGGRGLSTSHFIPGSPGFALHAAYLFSGLLTHGGHNTNVTDSKNYHGIASSSVLGHIFDLIVLHRYNDSLLSRAICSLVSKTSVSPT